MSGSLILLTGATGFVGFKTLVTALEHGYSVRAAVRSDNKAETVRSNLKLKNFGENQLSFVVVPDFLLDGAFDEAVRGVKFVVHVASPIQGPGVTDDHDLHAEFIRPAIQGTLGVFRSAQKDGGVERIVITSSAAAIVPGEPMAPESFFLFQLTNCVQ